MQYVRKPERCSAGVLYSSESFIARHNINSDVSERNKTMQADHDEGVRYPFAGPDGPE